MDPSASFFLICYRYFGG